MIVKFDKSFVKALDKIRLITILHRKDIYKKFP